jgi:hypothetical protein
MSKKPIVLEREIDGMRGRERGKREIETARKK